MKLSKEAMTSIILALNKTCEGYCELGLPVYEEAQMALMREVIAETLADFDA